MNTEAQTTTRLDATMIESLSLLQSDALDRLYDLRHIASNVGYGLEDDMDGLLAEDNPDDGRNRG